MYPKCTSMKAESCFRFSKISIFVSFCRVSRDVKISRHLEKLNQAFTKAIVFILFMSNIFVEMLEGRNFTCRNARIYMM